MIQYTKKSTNASTKRCSIVTRSNVHKHPQNVCFNCKYYKPLYYSQYGLCKHESSRYIDIIDGTPCYFHADEMRERKDLCGVQGKYYAEDTFINTILKYMYVYIIRDILYKNRYMWYTLIMVTIFLLLVRCNISSIN